MVELLGIDDAVLLGLHPELGFFSHPGRPVLPRIDCITHMNTIGPIEFQLLYRFDQESFQTIVTRLPFEDVLRTSTRNKYTLTEGFGLICARLAYPCRWSDLRASFGRHDDALSNIFWDLTSRILHRVKARILLAHQEPDRWESYKAAFVARGSDPNLSVAGSLDAKQLTVCRPTRHQRAMYTGHKQEHCLKFQTVVVPDGLIIHSTCGYSGRDHDSRIMRESGLLECWAGSPVLSQYRMIADSAYPNDGHVISLFTQRQRNNNPGCAAFNHRMSPLRQPVEWGYSRMTSLWSFLTMIHQMRTGSVSVSDLWLLSVWLTNLITCVDGGNIISDYYGTASPPTLEEYLSMTLN